MPEGLPNDDDVLVEVILTPLIMAKEINTFIASGRGRPVYPDFINSNARQAAEIVVDLITQWIPQSDISTIAKYFNYLMDIGSDDFALSGTYCLSSGECAEEPLFVKLRASLISFLIGEEETKDLHPFRRLAGIATGEFPPNYYNMDLSEAKAFYLPKLRALQ
jgi:hypothetical protein